MRVSGRLGIIVGGCMIALGLVSCDPCGGVVGCGTGSRVAVEGKIVNVANGRPVPGTRVDLIRGGGTDSVSALTDGQGFYALELPAQSNTDTNFVVGVHPPGKQGYRVPLALYPSTRHGDGTPLGPWVDEPYFAQSLEIYYRGGGDRRVPSVPGIFHRTGGAEITGPGLIRGEFHQFVDSFGRFTMFGSNVRSVSGDEVEGEVYVFLPEPREMSTIRGIKVKRQHKYGEPTTLRVVDAGPSTAYVGRFVSRATGLPVPRVRVAFRQTSGVPIGNPTFTTLSNAGGEFVFKLFPLGVGSVVGDLTVRPPPPDTGFVVHDIRLDTFDGEGARFLAQWGVGLHLPWLGIVHAQGKPIAGVEVEARRVGGVAATPAVLTVRSDQNGYFPLYGFAPTTAGTLLVDLTFRPPAPYASFVARNVALPTFNVDSDGRFIALWDVDRPPASAKLLSPRSVSTP